jgi:hypothetical protein
MSEMIKAAFFCKDGMKDRIRQACAKYAIVSYILHTWITRDVEARLKRSAKTRPVIVLTGARQTEGEYQCEGSVRACSANFRLAI